MVLVLSLREITQYFSSKIVPRTPVILILRITIASGLMIHGDISSLVKLESVQILHKPPVQSLGSPIWSLMTQIHINSQKYNYGIIKSESFLDGVSHARFVLTPCCASINILYLSKCLMIWELIMSRVSHARFFLKWCCDRSGLTEACWQLALYTVPDGLL